MTDQVVIYDHLEEAEREREGEGEGERERERESVCFPLHTFLKE